MASMAAPVSSGSAEPSPLVAAHALTLLNEYTHTLDSLPLDLSRNFADLRELDAVLSSSMTSVTTKITQLTDMLETKTVSPEDRLWLLADIADEVSRLKPGADDKIRVACHAADALRQHKAHMTTLLERMPDEEFAKTADRMGRKTKYPWVTDKLFGPNAHLGEGGRSRQRRLMANNTATDSASPNKRKRTAAEVDADAVNKSPRKERTGGDTSRQRNGSRKKAERAGSPTESLVSVASQMPAPQSNARPATSSRATNGSSSNKRARGNAPAPVEDPSPRVEFNQPPPTSHPSLPAPFASTPRTSNGVHNPVSEWPAGQLEGPGMPVARSFPSPPPKVAEADTDSVAAPVDGDPDGDDMTLYCICHRASFGEMIACDGVGCEVEWYHLECVGLESPPAGKWLCEDCRKKTNARRAGRGGKRRAGGGRSAARNTSA